MEGFNGLNSEGFKTKIINVYKKDFERFRNLGILDIKVLKNSSKVYKVRTRKQSKHLSNIMCVFHVVINQILLQEAWKSKWNESVYTVLLLCFMFF